ncbi:hypothetical protein HZA97_07235 [Candidatus Woesearchaeota archaeon]|nr:hypothetical protein [Candidatus Woesearchaeota archaeon]
MYEYEKFGENENYLGFKEYVDEKNANFTESCSERRSIEDFAPGFKNVFATLHSVHFGSYEEEILGRLGSTGILYSSEGLERTIRKNKDLPIDKLVIGLSEPFRKHDDFLVAKSLYSIIKGKKPELIIANFSLAAFLYFSPSNFETKKAIFYTPVYNENMNKIELVTLEYTNF